MLSTLILIVIMLSSSCSHGYKVLIYSPKLYRSHVVFMGRIADILADAGHDVVVLLPECDERIKTDGTVLARTIHAPCHFDVLAELLSLLDNIWSINARRVDFIIHMAWIFSSKENLICKSILADVELMRRLKEENFDLGISEAFSFCGFGVFDKIGLQKHLSAFNTEIFEAFTEPYGISYNPSHVPALLGSSSDMMNFMERVDNFIVFLNTYALTRLVAVPHALRPFEEHIRRPFTIVESIEILANCPFIFVNTNILFEFPRELNSKIVFVSGISASQSNSLDEDFQSLMDASTGGVVLVSFGTIALSSQMPPDLKSAFVSAFQHFPEITFIWKYELDDEVASDLPNVIKRKWVPQAGLLGHRNMRAFISHCGTNGLSESVNAGIPMVCVPLFFDQIRSAKKLEKQHIAFIIHRYSLSAQSIQSALRAVLYDRSYSISARRLSAMAKDVMIPLEEQISRHAKVAINMRKVEKLDPSGRRLNYFQFFLIDLTAIPLILIILLWANLCDL